MSDMKENQNKDAASPSSASFGRKFVRFGFKSLLWLFLVGILGVIVAGGAVTGYVAALVKDEKVRTQAEILEAVSTNSETGFVYFRDGTVVGQLRTEEDRRVVTYPEIPKYVEDALISTEDADFRSHIGIDFTALVRAVKQRVLDEDEQTGGSTITQQLARRVFLSLDKTDSRKIKEIFLSLRMERFMTKEDILAAYLNKVPFGNGSSGYNLFGIKAAAKGIFGLELNQLNLAQSAYLAGLPQQPSRFSAFTSKGELDEEGLRLALERQRWVLHRMRDTGKITEEQYRDALAFDLKNSLAKPTRKAYSTYPFLMLEVERQASETLVLARNPDLTFKQLRSPEYAEAMKDAREHLLRGGYKVYTTIDKNIYTALRAYAENPENFTKDDPKKGVEQVGAILLDNQTSAILGMIEGRDFHIEQMNHATQSTRQPGSAMKPIAAYLPALESGAIQPGDVIDDVPIILPDGTSGIHIPQNWDGKYHGLVTARQALNQSWNIPAIKLFVDTVTIPAAWDFAKKLGITSLTEDDYHARTGVIGGLEHGVSVEELTNAYSAIANKGQFNDAYLISKITDSEDNVIYEHKLAPEPVFSEQTAYLMTDMMRTVISSGTATEVKRRFKYGKDIPIVGKTGTTSENYDLWFVGYSPDVTLGVWVGYDQPSTLKESLRAKRVWADVMNTLVETKPELFATKEFEMPEGIVQKTVSRVSGDLPSETVIKEKLTVTDLFNRKYIPTKVDDVLQVAKIVNVKGKSYIPQSGTPDDMTRTMPVVVREEPISDLLKRIEELMNKIPEKKRKPLERYRPNDGFGDAPTETDPRVEDGVNPTPPAKLSSLKTDKGFKVMFSPSPHNDIAGYRVYRSVDGGPFQQMPGKTVLNGDITAFYDDIDENRTFGYYIVAVDIAGKTSAPSEPLYIGPAGGTPFNPSDTTGDGTDPLDSGAGDGSGDGGTGDGGGAAAGAPAAPSQPTAEARDLGVKLSWAASPAEQAVAKYNVYFAQAESGPYQLIGSTEGTTFEYISVSVGGWYRITAENGAGESPPSPSVHLE
ncbi:transglycosylase domain-containing protein [Paenibacillus thermotolerans]|uniref:transglycosylase domain-containing protein n=1 Tax=Paenibacillus thermotolerans TaxID=3027807 RepID=UPI0023680D47|nr:MULTISPECIES: transglycosylase domain-containing protein [unclassified Paenibacillus]